MVPVLVSFSIVLVMVLGSLSFLSASTKYSRSAQDVDLALEAAESGVNDLLAQLRVDPNYVDQVAAKKDDKHGYCMNPAVGGPAAEGDMFAADCGWGERPAKYKLLSGGQEYHYAVVSSSELAQSIVVVSTGRSNDVYRSIKVRISRELTTNWLYMTDYSITDPTDIEAWAGYTRYKYLPDATTEDCGAGYVPGASKPYYAWDASPFVPASEGKTRLFDAYTGARYLCLQVGWFGEGDDHSSIALDGPVHMNDVIVGYGMSMTGPVTSSLPRCKEVDPENKATWNLCTSKWLLDPNSPNMSVGSLNWRGEAPSWREPLEFPTTQKPKQMAFDDGVGCAYRGPTRIVLQGESMRVWSKGTTDYRDGCGAIAELESDAGAVATIPTDGLIFVDAMEGVVPERIKAGEIGDGLPLGTYTGEAPSAGAEFKEEIAMAQPEKMAGLGNVWIEGEFGGKNLTVVADRDIVVTGDVIAEPDSGALIGLMAGDRVEIFNPVMQTVKADATGTAWGTPVRESGPNFQYVEQGVWPSDYKGGAEEVYLDTAIYTTKASFTVQSLDALVAGRSIGTIRVHGSIFNRFSGATANPDDGGYDIGWTYNPALTKDEPLLFPPIVNGDWVIVWEEKVDPLPEVKTRTGVPNTAQAPLNKHITTKGWSNL
ncbi:MAG: hypothetical protein LBJ02_03045 [Bifidobacteriaceae bacterium]|jgi:hypothetical protein|nr:hypothetical protein [Bifidobacteriaceae bacterium]